MPANDPVRLVTLAPGHFHAALVQKEALPDVHPHVHIYAPLDGDLTAHLDRLVRFNTRTDRPTAWTVDVRAGPDFLERFLAERPGNTVVIAGRNKPKIDLILAAARLGYDVLADKPWVIDPADLPKVAEVFREADRHGRVVWDIMTERHEATTRVQRELIQDPAVFGELLPGTPEEPSLVLESVHYLTKQVSGAPLRRPAWWFDPAVAGDAIADVGTHLIDLAMWLLFPDQPNDAQRDIQIIDAGRWPTLLSLPAFREMTNCTDWPSELAGYVAPHGNLLYCGNGSVTFRLRGACVRATAHWKVKADSGADTHRATAHGSRSTISVGHEATFGTEPQVFVSPSRSEKAEVLTAVRDKCLAWSAAGAKYSAVDLGDHIHVQVPAEVRTGHESHFAAVLREFITYVRDPSCVPAWERSNLLAKYRVTTQAVDMSRAQGVKFWEP